MKRVVIVKKDNLQEVVRMLSADRGYLLISGPDFPTKGVVDFGQIHLYHEAKIQFKGNSAVVTTHRGTKKVEGEDYQTGWEESRLYTVRHRDGDDDFGEACFRKKYSFFLSMHSTVSQGFYYDRSYKSIFVPRNSERITIKGIETEMREALSLSLKHLAHIMQISEYTADEECRLLDIMLQDLKDKKCLMCGGVG